jgi:glycosyltransferase involved in cell wall biosynthesis
LATLGAANDAAEHGMSDDGRPKVAHICTVDLSLRFLLLDQLQALQRAGYEVVAISSPGPDVVPFVQAGIAHVPVSMSRRPFSPLADLTSLIALWRALRTERCAIVHTHNPKPGLLGQVAARLAGVPIVCNTVHGFYFHEHQRGPARRFYMLLERIAGRFSDLVFFQSREDMHTAAQQHICRAEQIRYLGNGIDLQRFSRPAVATLDLTAKRRRLGLPAQGPIVGFVGRLVREKGVLDLLAAARVIRMHAPQTRFLLVGPVDTPKQDAVAPAAAEAYGVADICHFVGKRDDLPELLALMDVLALPSYREGLPRAVMEASAMEVPCVVTNVRGCREAVHHGRNGLIVPLADVPALAAAIGSLLAEPETARRMGEEGRRIAVEEFDEQVVFGRVKAEYARQLREKGLRAPEPREQVVPQSG